MVESQPPIWRMAENGRCVEMSGVLHRQDDMWLRLLHHPGSRSKMDNDIHRSISVLTLQSDVNSKQKQLVAQDHIYCLFRALQSKARRLSCVDAVSGIAMQDLLMASRTRALARRLYTVRMKFSTTLPGSRAVPSLPISITGRSKKMPFMPQDLVFEGFSKLTSVR